MATEGVIHDDAPPVKVEAQGSCRYTACGKLLQLADSVGLKAIARRPHAWKCHFGSSNATVRTLPNAQLTVRAQECSRESAGNAHECLVCLLGCRQIPVERDRRDTNMPAFRHIQSLSFDKEVAYIRTTSDPQADIMHRKSVSVVRSSQESLGVLPLAPWVADPNILHFSGGAGCNIPYSGSCSTASLTTCRPSRHLCRDSLLGGKKSWLLVHATRPLGTGVVACFRQREPVACTTLSRALTPYTNARKAYRRDGSRQGGAQQRTSSRECRHPLGNTMRLCRSVACSRIPYPYAGSLSPS